MLVFAACLIAVGSIVFSIAAREKAEYYNERMQLASVYPKRIDSVDVEGFVLNILCDTNAKPLFKGIETTPDDMYRGAAMRNAHFEIESGASISVTVTNDFYNAAKNDILSGAYEYDMYASAVSGGLSRLLSEGLLYDLSESAHIDFDDEWYDKNTIDSLSVNGGKYLVSSDASDARWWSKAVAIDKSYDSGEELKNIALDGELTVDLIHTIGDINYNDDAYPLYFGAGGMFALQESFVSYADFCDCIENITPLASEREDMGNIFSLVTLYDIRESENVDFIPLPKVIAEDDYKGYADIQNAVLMAIPKGSYVREKTAYLMDSFARLSAEYVAPYFASVFSDNAKICDIIIDSASCDLTSLFGYGNMGELIAELMQDGGRTALGYYNRKALYEKSLDIISKRLEK